jgi:hypothetical protein
LLRIPVRACPFLYVKWLCHLMISLLRVLPVNLLRGVCAKHYSLIAWQQSWLTRNFRESKAVKRVFENVEALIKPVRPSLWAWYAWAFTQVAGEPKVDSLTGRRPVKMVDIRRQSTISQKPSIPSTSPTTCSLNASILDLRKHHLRPHLPSDPESQKVTAHSATIR